ncbi:titin-like [Ruditapes philippinarum]|uniref:titin-like n=1 Tax=Ruditapes philippinarum TaxID=129788 RepID=UPI00295B2751|nr:titin-like [Ruditapes philippinarum]XP_060565953.1 titin-like [Ruditapes philippinarum]
MWRALLLVLGANCIVSENPIILPAFNDVLVNSSLELACYTNKNVKSTQWGSLNHLDTFSHLYFSDNGSCITDGFLGDNQYFETSCYSNGTFKINIKRVNLSNHGQEWYCYADNRKSNISYITVRVPATEVIFDFHSNNSIYINENKIQTVSCKTSACLPKPLVKWYLRNPINNITYDITNQSTELYIPKENWLTIAESILRILPNRTQDRWHLYCAVWTQPKEADKSSKEFVLNVAYPPDGPPIIASYSNGSTIQVAESGALKLNCSVTGGKPLATLRMTCLNSNSTPTVTKETAVTVYITRQESRNHSQCICESDHIISGKQTSYVTFDVLFQPREVRFNFGTEAGGKLTVSQNEEVTFQCFAESNPHPDIAIGNQRDKEIIMMKNTNSVQHIIHSVSCADAGEYVCSARNMLTNGEGAQSKLVLIVRCPPCPSPDTLKETNITALLHCDVTLKFFAQDFFDEQNKTEFAWYKQISNVSLQNDKKYIISSNGLQSNLIIRNITYSDYGQYRVSVRNSYGNCSHYYELLENAPQQSTEPFTASTLFRVAVGISSFTLLVIIMELFFWINIRRKQTS